MSVTEDPKYTAVACNPRRLQKAKTELRKLGTLIEIPQSRIVVVKYTPGAPQRASTILSKLKADGDIEFVTTVMRDDASGLLQILTDEITVRFKQVPDGAAVHQFEQKHGVRLLRKNEFVARQFVFSTPDPEGDKTMKKAAVLDQLPEVEFSAANFITQIG